jgi:pilus assembly protein CpaF
MATYSLEDLLARVPPNSLKDVTVHANGNGASLVTSNGNLDPTDHLRQLLLAALSAAPLAQCNEPEARMELGHLLDGLTQQPAYALSGAEQESLIDEVVKETFGYGPIDDLMHDQEISEILINGPRQVFIEKRGQLHPAGVHFRDDVQLMQFVGKMAVGTGRRLDKKSPMLDARLPDGSRLNVVLKPPALNGPLVSIRRFGTRPLTTDDLLANESITNEMLTFLTACVKCRMSIVISGGTGSGKTTLLNSLSRFIGSTERIVTIEDTAELELQQPHVAKMEAQPPNLNGDAEISMRDLVKNALRMRPDRIIIGECRGAEALEMLQAMNTGHEGSMTTIHANTAREAITRIELMISLAGIDIAPRALRKLITSSINIVIQVSRVAGGKRKIMSISEITGMEEDTVSMHDLFQYVQTGLNTTQAAEGYFKATGIRPQCLAKLTARGASLPMDLFMERRLQPGKAREAGR